MTSERDEPQQATVQELAEGARRHYEELSNAACHWSTIIPQAIDAWERERLAREAPTAEPVAFTYEFATMRNAEGEYLGWKPGLSWTAPSIPDDAIRNLRPLYAGVAAPAAERIEGRALYDTLDRHWFFEEGAPSGHMTPWLPATLLVSRPVAAPAGSPQTLETKP